MKSAFLLPAVVLAAALSPARVLAQSSAAPTTPPGPPSSPAAPSESGLASLPAVVVRANPQPVVVDVGDAAASTIDPAAVRDAVARELGVPVVAAMPAAPASPVAAAAPVAPRGHLTIALDAARRIVVIYRDAAGREVMRATAMPHDPAAAVGIIALLAGNLARNEALDLLAAPSTATATVVMPDAALPTPTPQPPATPATPAPPARARSLQPVVVAVPGAPANALTDARHDPRALASLRHGGRLAVQLDAGAAISGSGLGPIYALRAAYRMPARHLALGLDGTFNQPAPQWRLSAVNGSLLATVRGEWAVGVARFDVGAGLGVMWYRTFDVGGSSGGMPVMFDLATAAVRIGGGVAFALTSWLDLTFRTDLTSPLWSEYVDSGGGRITSPLFFGEGIRYLQLAGTLGLQVRVL